MDQSASSSRLTENGPDTNNEEPKFKGVRKRKWGKWVSEIRLPNSRERIWLGSYDTAQKAARAFDAAQFCLRGRNASFNFPDNPPDIPGGRSMSPQEIQEAAAKYANEETRQSTDESQSRDEFVGPPTIQVEGDEVVDWSFWDMLDGNYAGFGHMSSDFFPPLPPFAPPEADGDIEEQNEDETAFSSSFLWNF